LTTSITDGPTRSLASPTDLLDLAHSFEPSRAFLTGLELGFFTILGSRALPAAEVALSSRTHPAATERLLNALAGIGLLSKRGDRFANTALSSRYLVEGSPDHLAGLLHSANGWGSWSSLTYAIETGHPLGSTFVDAKDKRRATEAYMAAMASQAARFAPKVVPHLGLEKRRRLLDVGGGPGIFSIAFARANPKLEITVLDRAEIAPICRRNVRKAALSRRVKFQVGNYLSGPLGEDYDLAYFSQVIHGNSAEENHDIMARASAALAPGGAIAVLDYLMDSSKITPATGALFSLSMLLTSDDGSTYAVDEVSGWLERAGLRVRRPVPISGGQSLLVGVRRPAQRRRKADRRFAR
jgi:predicted O-methyltransferase YrrM